MRREEKSCTREGFRGGGSTEGKGFCDGRREGERDGLRDERREEERRRRKPRRKGIMLGGHSLSYQRKLVIMEVGTIGCSYRQQV